MTKARESLSTIDGIEAFDASPSLVLDFDSSTDFQPDPERIIRIFGKRLNNDADELPYSMSHFRMPVPNIKFLDTPNRESDFSPPEKFTEKSLWATLDAQIRYVRKIILSEVNKILTGKSVGSSTLSLQEAFDLRVERTDLPRFESAVKLGLLGPVDDHHLHLIKSSFEVARKRWQNERSFILFLKDRLNESTDSSPLPSVVERTERLAAYAKDHGDEGLEAFARLLFPEWSVFQSIESDAPGAPLELPKKAPEIYQGLRGPETPPAFVQRVYGEWLGHGLTRAHIRKLDPVLYTAMNNWLKKPECEWPTEVDLPTLKEQNTRDIQALREGAPVNVTLQEMRRLQGAIQRRDEGRIK